MFKTKLKFEKGDIAFTKKDHEKVLVMKAVEPVSDRNTDLGQEYLVRGDENKMRVVFEFELLTLEEVVNRTPPVV